MLPGLEVANIDEPVDEAAREDVDSDDGLPRSGMVVAGTAAAPPNAVDDGRTADVDGLIGEGGGDTELSGLTFGAF